MATKLVTKSPNDCIIVGIDIAVTEENKAYHDPFRNHDPNAEFVASVKERWIGSITGIRFGKIILVKDGRRRVLAARKAGRDEIIVLVEDDGTALDVQLANAHRLEDSPLVKARNAARLKELGHTNEEIMIAFGGVSKMQLTYWKRLLLCIPEIQDLIESGKITATLGYELGKLQDDEQKTALAEILANGLKGESANEHVRAHVAGEAGGEDSGEPGEAGERRPRGKGIGHTTRKMIKLAQAQELYAWLSPEEGEGEVDPACDLAMLVVGVILGEDPDCLKKYPELHKLAVHVLK